MKENFELIILTSSTKFGGHCVAGINPQNGRFYRLITLDQKSHGALSEQNLIAGNGRRIERLDCVYVRGAEYQPGEIQTENYVITEPLQYLGRESIDTVLRAHPLENRESIFYGRLPYMKGQIDGIGHSLELLCIENLRVYSYLSRGKTKTKADFSYNGYRYTGFSVTDQKYFDQEGEGLHIHRACVVFSIADDEWARENGYYKYLAAIYRKRPIITRKDKSLQSL